MDPIMDELINQTMETGKYGMLHHSMADSRQEVHARKEIYYIQ
jgi:hypothetical protein